MLRSSIHRFLTTLLAAAFAGSLVFAAGCDSDDPNNPSGDGLWPGGDGSGNGEQPVDLTPPAGCTVPATITASCSAGICRIPAGCFAIGSPSSESCREDDETLTWVRFSRSFEISATEVTQVDYQTTMGYNPSKHTNCGPSCPVDSVTWSQAAAYANARSSAAGLAQCYSCNGSGPAISCTVAQQFGGQGQTIYDCPGYRLPTEAEWEYAYRAGSHGTYYNTSAFVCSNADALVDEIAWYNKNSGGTTHPVQQKKPNGWGLYDMAGNVEEWVHDGYGAYPAGLATDLVVANPNAKAQSARGGSYHATSLDARGADRNNWTGTDTFSYQGFRIARTVP